MLTLNQRTDALATDSVTLVFDERKRCRLRVTLASGREAGVFLERGDHLRGGDRLLAAEDGTVVEIVAAPERLIEAVAESPLHLARAAYHLGNRHVPLQILAQEAGGRLRFQVDHVLAEMVKGLGCAVTEIEAPFQPEPGAYRAHGHQTGDLHDPGHGLHRSMPKIHQFTPR